MLTEDDYKAELSAFKQQNSEIIQAVCRLGGTLCAVGAVGGGILGFAGTGSLTAAFTVASVFGGVPLVSTAIGYGLQYLAIKPQGRTKNAISQIEPR